MRPVQNVNDARLAQWGLEHLELLEWLERYLRNRSCLSKSVSLVSALQDGLCRKRSPRQRDSPSSRAPISDRKRASSTAPSLAFKLLPASRRCASLKSWTPSTLRRQIRFTPNMPSQP